MAAEEKIILDTDTGSTMVEIRDKGEPIGQFRFNPNDPDIIKRCEHVVEALDKLTVPEDSNEEAVFAISDEIKKHFDYLLNYNVSEEIFCKCNPLTLTKNGDFYCEDVLNKIIGIIEKVSDQRLKKKEAKVKKAVAKYAGK